MKHSPKRITTCGYPISESLFEFVAFPQDWVSLQIILRLVEGMSHHLFKWELG